MKEEEELLGSDYDDETTDDLMPEIEVSHLSDPKLRLHSNSDEAISASARLNDSNISAPKNQADQILFSLKKHVTLKAGDFN